MVTTLHLPLSDRDHAKFYKSKVEYGATSWVAWIKMLMSDAHAHREVKE